MSAELKFTNISLAIDVDACYHAELSTDGILLPTTRAVVDEDSQRVKKTRVVERLPNRKKLTYAHENVAEDEYRPYSPLITGDDDPTA